MIKMVWGDKPKANEPATLVDAGPDKLGETESGVPTGASHPVTPPKPVKVTTQNTNLDWLDDDTENLLIFGPPKHGKTYAYMSYIKNTIDNEGKVYIISTDSGIARTLKRYFKNIGVKNVKDYLKDNIIYEHVYNVDMARKFWLDNRDILTKKDLLIVDLISQFYEWLQADFIDVMSRGQITKYIFNASNDPKKFGIFESSKWNYIKAAHRFLEDIITRKRCNTIAVCTEKDTEGEKAIGGSKAEGKLRKIYLTDMSVRAGGQRELPYLFDTMVRIAMIGENKFAMLIVGDRGYTPNGKVVEYESNLKEAIDKFRGEQK